ncbi:MAG: polysaccharide biosynthesis protein [Gammaproteobacteria bacterium]|nr:polysaccharide biosynthesis protein [Gammaproteobacteria bacterium]
MLVADAVMIPLALWSAFFVYAGTFVLDEELPVWLFPLTLVFSIPAFVRLGLYRAVVRFMGGRVVIAVLKGVSISVILLAIVALAAGLRAHTLQILIIYWTFALLYVGGSRFVMRAYLQRQRKPGDRVVIYGAGEAGARLAAALAGGQEFLPVAFIDDNVSAWGSVINGIEVHGPNELPRLVDDLEISRVLLALPSVSRRSRQEILTRLEPLAVHVQTMPNFSDLVSGKARVDDIHDVDVADLLGRDAVPPNDALMDACIRGKSVMVTGAGGSIGAELCRQIIQLGPQRLLLFELSEVALYTIEKELRLIAAREKLSVEIVALLGSAHHKYRVREVMINFEVETVYHAAAYKHVPVVEHNMIEGIHNNVFGTWHTAEAAIEAHVRTFVLISTDKAVCPTNVMGATKRFSELVLQGLDERGSKTRFCMVRFGNVLASSGSVVPLFREQIRRGGPVTVTHPAIIRYFMTIREAAQLVIQAGSMGQGGDVFVLDMGKPVRIEDLARRMIHLMGLEVRDENNPDGDIAIKYTGLRPAEKLYEELLIGNNVMGTEHPMIWRALEESLNWENTRRLLEQLLQATRQFDCDAARTVLLESVAGYAPTGGVEDLVWQRRAMALRKAAKPGKVTDLSTRRASP